MASYSIVMSGPLGTFDITSKTLSASWSRSLGESAATLSLECINISNYHCMDTVTLIVDGQTRFSGTVKNQSESYSETVKRVNFDCIDNTDRLYHIIVAETYENQTTKQIIESLQTNYATWLDLSLVQDVGGPIEQLNFNYETLGDCIAKLAEINGAYWNIDAANRLSFFQEIGGYASVDYTPQRILNGSFSLDYSAVELVNRVWVIGAKQSSPTVIEQTFAGDDNNQYFLLAYVPNYPKVYENGVLKTIALAKDEAPTTNYVYNKVEKVLKRVAGNLPSGITLRIEYNPTVQIIDYFEDTTSVTQYGRYERVIRDKKITDKLAARKRGRSELKRVRNVIRYAKWNSRTWQVEPGEVSRVIMPAFSINAFFRINAIEITFTPEDIVASIDAEEVEQ